MIKKIVKNLLRKRGYQIKKIDQKTILTTKNKFSMEEGFKRCLSRGLKIATVIDVGASDGRWSERLMKFYPDANYLLIEAQQGHLEGLKACKERNPKLDFVLAAAGRAEGKIYFDHNNLFGGLASDTPLDGNCIEVPVISVDEEVKKRKLQGPYLLKLDTHGYEIPILEGAKEMIQAAELVIIEVYNFQLTTDSLKFWEMCSYMEKLGFYPVELVDPMLRKHDEAFWQMDLFFIPSKSPIFLNNTYDAI
jgi:FkbM family methyltransferase